jgi:uncharacterized membrane protein
MLDRFGGARSVTRRRVLWLAVLACSAGWATVGSMPAIAASSGPDLVVSLSGAAPAASGGVAQFTATVHNLGGSSATGAVVVQFSGSGDTGGAISATGSGWSCSSATEACESEGPVSAGSALSSITVRVPAGAVLTGTGNVGLRAVVSNASDSITSDNSASAQEPVVAASGVDLVPTVAAGPPVAAGAQATFQVGVSNVGGAASAGNVEVVIAPQGEVNGQWTATGTGWSCPEGSGRCTISAAAVAGESLPPLTVRVSTLSSYPSARWVGLNVMVVNTSDAVSLNNSASAQIPLGPPSGVDLEVGAHAEGAVAAGQNASFTVAVRNVGDMASAGQTELTLSPQGSAPDGTVFASGEGWSCSNTSLVCDYNGAIAPGTVAPPVHVEVGTSKAFPASAGLSVVVSDVGDGVSGDKSGSAEVPVVAASGVDLAAGVAGGGPVVAGGNGTFHVAVVNLGGSASSGQVEVALRSYGSVGGEWSGSGSGWVCPAGSGRCVYSGVVSAGETLPELTVTVPTVGSSIGRNDVGLAAQVINASDAIEQDNSSSGEDPVTQLAQPVDLVVTLSQLGPVKQGQAGAVTALVTNTGSNPSSGPVTVQLNSSFRGATASGSGWTCTSTLACTHASPVPAGGSLPAITMSFTPPASDALGSYQVSAQVSNGSDADTTNNETAVEGGVGGVPVDLTVNLTGLEALAAGEHGSFDATVTNSGTSASTGPITVQLNAPFPGAKAGGSGWTCTSTLVCSNPGPLAAGAGLPPITTTFTTPTQDAVGEASFAATVEGGADAVTANNAATATSGIGGIPVDLTATLTGTTALRPGQHGSATIHVANTGSKPSTGRTTVQLSGPPGATASGTGWSCSSGLACTNESPVSAGETLPDLTMAFTPSPSEGPGLINLSASLANSSDADTKNNSTSLTSGIGGVPVDLALSLVPTSTARAGSQATFRAQVTNSGTSASSGQVTVQLNAPFAGAAASGEGWTCTSTLACTNPGPVNPGGGLPDITLTVPVPADEQPSQMSVNGTLTNSSDANTTNNTSNVTVPLTNPSVTASSSSSYFAVQTLAPHVAPGDQEELQVQLNGDEPLVNQPATVTITLPTGISYVPHSVAPSGLGEPTISNGGAQLTWNVMYPSQGTTTTFRFAVSIPTSASAGQNTITGHLVATALASEQTDGATFEIAHPSLEGVTPKAIGQSTQVTVSFSGALLRPSDTFELVNGPSTLKATSATGEGAAVNATFDTSSATAGEYDAKVITASGQQLVLPTAIAIGGGNTPEVSVELNGPSRVRLNAVGNYYATVTNTGNVDLFNVPVILTTPTGVTTVPVEPNAKALLTEAVETMSGIPATEGGLSAEQEKEVKAAIQAETPAAIPDPSGEQQYAIAFIPQIPAGASVTTQFQVTPTSHVTGNVAATVPVDNQYLATTDQVSNVDQHITLPLMGKTASSPASGDVCAEYDIPPEACATTRLYVHGLQSAQHLAQNYACVSFSDVTFNVIGSNCQFDLLGPIKWIFGQKFPLISGAKDAFDILKDLFHAGDQLTKTDSGVQLGVASVDPNDLAGPQGVGPQHYIAATTTVDYQIKFENLPSATASAQRVTIEDSLPPEIDASTTRIVGVEVGGTPVTLAETSNSGKRVFTGTAVLDSITGRSVDAEGTVNEGSRVVTIYLQGPPNLDDPFTPSPYSDFLPQNTTPPIGEGTVRLEGKLQAGLATGTVVSNKATVTFDDDLGGSPLETPTVTNTIDADPPKATMSPLPSEVSEAAVLEWTATDIGSGVAGVDIFESTDGGSLTEIAANQGGSSVRVPVTAGHVYSFAVRPVDNVGNVGAIATSNSTRAVEPPASGGGGKEGHEGGSETHSNAGGSSGGGGSTSGSGAAGSSVQNFGSVGAPVIQLAGRPSIKGTTVSVPVRCPATSGNCRAVSAVLSVIENVRNGRIVGLAAQKHRGVIRRRTVLASVTVTLAAGQSKMLKLTLNATGRRLLTHYKKFAAEIELVESGRAVSLEKVTLLGRSAHRRR